MAMNPMQRRARTSFIIGFLVALIIGALAVGGLLLKIRSINEAKEAIEALQKQVYVATEDLESGDEVTMDDFVKGIVQTSMTTDEMITPDYFEFEEDGEIITKLDDDGNQIQKTMVMKINVPKGTIITKDMMYESGKGLKDSERIQEFNMIRLPSQLKNGDTAGLFHEASKIIFYYNPAIEPAKIPSNERSHNLSSLSAAHIR